MDISRPSSIVFSSIITKVPPEGNKQNIRFGWHTVGDPNGFFFLWNCKSGGNVRPAVAANPNFALGFERLSKIVVGLHAKPRLGSTSESFGQADGHFRTDTGAKVDEIVQRLSGNTKYFRSRCHAQSEWPKAFLPNNTTRVRRVFHRHDGFPFLMIINQLNVKSVSILKSENDPPIGANGNGPVSSTVAL